MDPLLNTVIAGCRIEEEIGRGGMGVVYRGRHLGLEIPVAIKILRPIDNKVGTEERFLREARTAARLRHPNIVGVLNVGCEQGLHFIVMEYVDGKNVFSLIEQQGKIALPEALRIARQILDALEVAFAAGVIHRDIKPENILIDRNGTAKIADLGLARASTDPRLTCSDVALGSPFYIAPEQAENPGNADHRADIYSLGCTLFHMISGSPPYQGTAALEIILEHIRKPVPSLGALDPLVPDAISAAVARMMAKDPAGRFQTPSDAKASLAGNVPANSSPGRRRKQGMQIAAVVCAIAVIAISVPVYIRQTGRSKAILPVARIQPSPAFVSPAPGADPSPEPKQAGGIKTDRPIPPQSGVKKGPAKKVMQPAPHRPPTRQERKSESIMNSVEQGETQVLEWLLENGVPSNPGEGAPTTPLHLAVHNGSAEQVRLLLNKGANPNIADQDGDYPLHYAIRDQDALIVKLLLDYGANPNVKDRWNETPLGMARALKNETVRRLLEEKGARQ
jgi:serine/threonine protein kinase